MRNKSFLKIVYEGTSSKFPHSFELFISDDGETSNVNCH